MADKTIFDRVKEITADTLGCNPDQVTPEAKFVEDLGSDSLDVIELLMAFEEEFSLEIPDEHAEQLFTVADVVKYLQEATGGG